MKKIINIIVLLAIILLSSCSTKENIEALKENLEPQKALAEVSGIQQICNGDNVGDESLKYYVDYPIFTNSNFSDTIHNYFDNLVKEKQENCDTSNNLNPELHATFYEFKGENIRSIMYDIFEYTGVGEEREYVKVFFIEESGKELFVDEIFLLDDYNKEKLKIFLSKKIREFRPIYTDEKNLNLGLDKYLNEMEFYIDGENVVFLFEDNQFGVSFGGVFRIYVNIFDLKDYFTSLVKLPSVKKPVEYENIDLSDYIIYEQIGEIKTDSKEEAFGARDFGAGPEGQLFDKDKKYIALTFDDGPSKTTTRDLLDTLEKNGVKATFFVLGKNAEYFPDIIKEIDAKGHEIGSHSYNHPRLTRLNEEDLKYQISHTDEVVFNTIGKTPRLLRPPYGEYNDYTNEVADRTIIMWNVDSLDWKTRNIDSNITNISKDTKEGSIILMHDIHRSSVDSVDGVIKALKEKGFEFLTVSELLNHYQTSDYFGKVCTSGFTCK